MLAGGASRRMGADKRGLPIDGTPMLQRVIDRVAGQPVIVVVDPRRDPPPVALSGHVRFVDDLRPGEGPLAALEAGLAAAHDPVALVVATDMPWLEPLILDLLVERLATTPAASIVCLGNDRGPQPFPMVCRRAATLARVTALLDTGERRLQTLLGDTTTIIPEGDWRVLDPTGRSLMDIDTPADLALAR